MALRDSWHRTLVYFGLAEEDDHLHGEYDDYEDDYLEDDEYESRRSRRSREANVRRLPTSRRGRHDEIDDIFSDDEPMPSGGGRSRNLRSVEPENGASAVMGDDVQVHLVIPRNFNDAQQVADQFKRKVPVILNLQTTDHELSKRLIDFASGLTYALDGGMQRIAEKVFLLTPRNVEVSAEEKARLIDKGFFNQS